MIRTTPFHACTAKLVQHNAWTCRNGFAVPQSYADAGQEALAARASAALSDISFRTRLQVSGTNASAYLSRLATQNVARLDIGAVVRCAWLDDDGVIRSHGLIARLARETFILESDTDADWIRTTAAPFDLSLVAEEAGLLLAGPAAERISAALGLKAPASMCVQQAVLDSMDIVLCRQSLGLALWCAPGHATSLWHRLQQAGMPYAMRLMGSAALDILEMENLHLPAQLIDELHTGFNGRSAYFDARAKNLHSLVGLDVDAEIVPAGAGVIHQGRVAGKIVRTLYSPALMGVVAVAEVEKALTSIGTRFVLGDLSGAHNDTTRAVAARVVETPFLPL